MLGGSCSPCCANPCEPVNALASDRIVDGRVVALYDVAFSTDRFSFNAPRIELTRTSEIVPAVPRFSDEEDLLVSFRFDEFSNFLGSYQLAPHNLGLPWRALFENVWAGTYTLGSGQSAQTVVIVHNLLFQLGSLNFQNLYFVNNTYFLGVPPPFQWDVLTLQAIVFERILRYTSANVLISDTGLTPRFQRNDPDFVTDVPSSFLPNRPLNMLEIVEFRERLCGLFTNPERFAPSYQLKATNYMTPLDNWLNTGWDLRHETFTASMAGNQRSFTFSGRPVQDPRATWRRSDSPVASRGTLPWSLSGERTATRQSGSETDPRVAVLKPSLTIQCSVQDIRIEGETQLANETIPGPFSVAPSDGWVPDT